MRTATHLNMRLNPTRPARRAGVVSPRRLWFPTALAVLALAPPYERLQTYQR